MFQGLATPIKSKVLRLQRTKRFVRKPAAQKSQRSFSRKSFDSTSVREMYVRSPASLKKQATERNFFESFASEMIQTSKKQRVNPEILQHFDYEYPQKNNTGTKSLQTKIQTLQSQIELKNHQLSILAGERERIKIELDNEKNRRQKFQQQRKQLSKELKQTIKKLQQSKINLKKANKEKQYLIKQVQFLQQINFDQNTRDIQSYREKFLAEEVDHLKKELKRSKQGRESQLQNQMKKIQQEKYTLQSHYKAMKIANQCLVKQLNQNSHNIHQIILNSEEYIKLREKYIRFLDQYKNLRNQYWTLKAQVINSKSQYQNSSLFNITSSDADISLKEKSIQVINSFQNY